MTTATERRTPSPDAVQRRARARAQAAVIVDRGSTTPRLRAPERGGLRSTARRRVHAPAPPRIRIVRPSLRRSTGAVVLLVQCAVLGWLLMSATFRVGSPSIDGVHLISTAEVADVASVQGANIFTIDGAAIRTRLLAQPWVRDATVTTSLPRGVHISVTEWAPALRVHSIIGDTLYADSGASIPAAGDAAMLAATPVLVDERTDPSVPSAQLVQMLDSTASRFPAGFGTGVAAFEWRTDGILVIWAEQGWSAVLGHADTADAIAQIPQQLAVLAALRSQLHLASPSVGYIDLENPAAPAGGGVPGIPAALKAALSAPITPVDAVLISAAERNAFSLHTILAIPARIAAVLAAHPVHAPTVVTAPAPAPATAAPAPSAAVPSAAPAAPAAPTPTPYVIYIQPPPSH